MSQNVDLADLLDPNDIIPNLAAKNRESVLLELAALLAKNHSECPRDAVAKALAERERDGTTGIGMGVAIPHTRFPGLKKTLLAFGRSEAGIDFGAVDGKPVHLFFLLLAAENSLYLKILARLSQGLQNEGLRADLRRGHNGHDLFETLKKSL